MKFPADNAVGRLWYTMKISMLKKHLKLVPLCPDFYIEGQRAIWSH